MKNAFVRDRCRVPDSEGWKNTPCRRIQSRQLAEWRIARRASPSLVRPPVTLRRSCQNSSSG